MVVAYAALVTVVAFLLGRATRPKVRVKTVPLTFIGLLGRLIWWVVSRIFRLLWIVVRLFVSEVSSW
jgi:hypothetical protein